MIETIASCRATALRAAEPGSPHTPSAKAARSAVAVAAVVLGAIGALADLPVLVLLCLIGSTTCVLRAWLAWPVAIPASALTMVGVATAAGVIAAPLDWDLLSRPQLVQAVLVAASASVALMCFRTPGPFAETRTGLSRAAAVWVHLPAVMAAAIGTAQGLSTTVAAAWAFNGTDLAQHMVEYQRVQASGFLDYASGGYPKGFHALAALAAPGSHEAPEAVLAQALRLVAASSWLALATVLVAGAWLILQLADRFDVRPHTAQWAAGGFGWVILVTNPVVNTFVYMGAVPSLLAVIALWAVPAVALHRRRSHLALLLITAAVSTFLLAHLWQALLLVPGTAVLLMLLARSRRAEALAFLRRPRPTVVGLVSLAALGAAPPLLGVLRDGGTALAGIPGELPHTPWYLLAVGLVSFGIRFRGGGEATRAFLGAAVGLIASSAVVLRGAGGSWDLTQYYPMKTLWFLALVLAPFAALTACTVVGLAMKAALLCAQRIGPSPAVSRAAAAASVVASLFSFAVPQVVATPSATAGAVRASWDEGAAGQGLEYIELASANGHRSDGAVAVPVAVGSSVVFDRFGTYVVSKLLSMKTGQPQNHGKPYAVCQDVASVAGTRPAVVFTKLDPRLLAPIMAADGCADVPVVRVPGQIADTSILKVRR